VRTTRATGSGVIRLIVCSSARARAGEPSASITTTPSGVTTKPAFEMKLPFSREPTAECPCTYQACADT
jgi:hypothetical protein